MESGQSLKRRMKSVRNIGTITKAMELVAATKMRRSQELALHSRPYAYAALELLGILSGLKDVPMPELLAPREIKRTAFLVVTSDKGLAGSFNGSVFRAFEQYVRAQGIDVMSPSYSFIAVGQKSKSYFARRKMDVIGAFTRAGDFTRLSEIAPIADFLIAGYERRDFDEVILVSTDFITALHQEVFVRQILPVSFEKIKESIELLVPQAGKYSEYLDTHMLADNRRTEYIIEPSAAEVLAELVPELLKIRIYHAILEANASEHSARRVAMKNASDNARDLSESLTMIYNKSRQAAITREIIEVTAGASSVA